MQRLYRSSRTNERIVLKLTKNIFLLHRSCCSKISHIKSACIQELAFAMQFVHWLEKLTILHFYDGKSFPVQTLFNSLLPFAVPYVKRTSVNLAFVKHCVLQKIKAGNYSFPLCQLLYNTAPSTIFTRNF